VATRLELLSAQIRACRVCESRLPCGPRPVFAAGPGARLLVIGQAPGIKVHESGIAWNDRSGERLRQWLALDRSQFYDIRKVAIVPMGLCYPGRARHGDAPPRPECAPLWHVQLLPLMKKITLTLLIGAYAQGYYLGARRKESLTSTVMAWREFQPAFFVLPHPSPRNDIWLRRNPWFEKDCLPPLREQVRRAVDAS